MKKYNAEAWGDLEEMFKSIATDEEMTTFRQLFKHNLIEEVKNYMLKVCGASL